MMRSDSPSLCAGDSSPRYACYADHHMTLGPHKIEFEALEGWGRLPECYAYVEVAGVACDSRDRVYVFNRGAYPVIIFDKDGKFLNAWGKGVFKNPHGIFIDGKDNLWLADDKDHTVHKFTADGERLMTIGQSGKPSDTGYGINKSPVKHAGTVPSRDQRRGAPRRGYVHRGRLWQRARPQVLGGREAPLLVGREGQRTRGVHAAARDRGRQ